jgi:hypothetical protein
MGLEPGLVVSVVLSADAPSDGLAGDLAGLAGVGAVQLRGVGVAQAAAGTAGGVAERARAGKREEIKAHLAAPDINHWIGRRDRALLMVAVQTGLRVSELTGLLRRRSPRPRRPRPLSWQGTKGTLHTTDQPDHRSAVSLAA